MSEGTAICRWMEDGESEKHLERHMEGVRKATGAKTLDWFCCATQTVVTLDKKREAALIPLIYNQMLARGQRIFVYNAENLQPVAFEPGERFTKEEYLIRYGRQYGDKATRPNRFGA